MRETCTKRIFSEPRALIKLEPRDEISRENYDCSFKIHLPVGRKIALNISVITQQPTDQVDTYYTTHTNITKLLFFLWWILPPP